MDSRGPVLLVFAGTLMSCGSTPSISDPPTYPYVPGAYGFTCGVEGVWEDLDWTACDDPWLDQIGLGGGPVVEYEGCVFAPLSAPREVQRTFCAVDEPLETACSRLPGADVGCPDFLGLLYHSGWMQNRDAGSAVRCLERHSNIPYDVFYWFEGPPPEDVRESAMLLVHWGVFETSGELVGISSGFWTATGWFRYCCSGTSVSEPVWGRWFDLECNGPGTWSYEPDDFR